jgi:hypothetical protein
MRRGKPVEAEHFVVPFCQLVKRGASYRAETAYDRVEFVNHKSQWRQKKTQLVYSTHESSQIAIASRQERL